MTLRRILVAVDGSEPAQRAIGMAAGIAAHFGAKVTLVYVISPLPMPPDAYTFDIEQIDREQHQYAESLLRQSIAAAEEPGVEMNTLLLHGAPAEAITEAALAEDVDLVVVGSRGRSAVARVLLGSISDRLLHICKKPVLVVH